MNVCQQKVLVTSLIGVGMPIIALCMSMLIKISKTIDQIIATAICSSIGIVSVVVSVLMLKYMAELHINSQEILTQWQKSCAGTRMVRRKLVAYKIAASCPPLKVKFGTANYIEKTTPLKCADVACNLTVQILLLT